MPDKRAVDTVKRKVVFEALPPNGPITFNTKHVYNTVNSVKEGEISEVKRAKANVPISYERVAHNRKVAGRSDIQISACRCLLLYEAHCRPTRDLFCLDDRIFSTRRGMCHKASQG